MNNCRFPYLRLNYKDITATRLVLLSLPSERDIRSCTIVALMEIVVPSFGQVISVVVLGLGSRKGAVSMGIVALSSTQTMSLCLVTIFSYLLFYQVQLVTMFGYHDVKNDQLNEQWTYDFFLFKLR